MTSPTAPPPATCHVPAPPSQRSFQPLHSDAPNTSATAATTRPTSGTPFPTATGPTKNSNAAPHTTVAAIRSDFRPDSRAATKSTSACVSNTSARTDPDHSLITASASSPAALHAKTGTIGSRSSRRRHAHAATAHNPAAPA